ncbi:hypothetical protein AVEN_27441-1 [Araneus ventricosus]|uniref:Uncharacterized protein n=1 Tax=Araneus ventricosus TaxID=182803 RepID=A0A4Y2EFX1_ARAVE|nr:hypothetical protein AVEN_27441-1 [Araneus ventricosus]
MQAIQAVRKQTNWQKTRRNMGNSIYLLSYLNRTSKSFSGRVYLRSGKLPGTMAMRAEISIISCPQLVLVPLTGLKRKLSSPLNMALSLSTSKGFAYLTAINASYGGTGTSLHYATVCALTVSGYMRRTAPSFEQEWLKRVANNFDYRQRIRRVVKFISENRNLFRPP